MSYGNIIDGVPKARIVSIVIFHNPEKNWCLSLFSRKDKCIRSATNFDTPEEAMDAARTVLKAQRIVASYNRDQYERKSNFTK